MHDTHFLATKCSGTGKSLLGRASGMADVVAFLRTLWERLPLRIRASATGRSWLKAFITRVYQADCFAGRLEDLFVRYQTATEGQRRELDAQIERIMCHLLMANGTLKATMAGRNSMALERAMPYLDLRDGLRILEIGGSLGIDSLGNFELLSHKCRISDYVVGDLDTIIYVDRERQAVFDATGRLLQVKLGSLIFNQFSRRDTKNHPFILLSAPIARCTTRRYPFRASEVKGISMLHPLLAEKLSSGQMQAMELDVLKPLSNRFDIIISFNLIDDEYFSDAELLRIMQNLRDGLEDNGRLVVGVSNSITISVKSKGCLKLVYRDASSWGERFQATLERANSC